MHSAWVPAVNGGLKWKWDGEKEQITLLKHMHCLLAGPPAEQREERTLVGGLVWMMAAAVTVRVREQLSKKSKVGKVI